MNKYFNREEFECKCGCGFDTVDAETLKVITDVRKHFNSPVIITSAARCREYNRKVGGGIKSQHLRGRACDIQVKFIHPDLVYAYLDKKYPDRYGLGKYGTFTHIDTRSGVKARW